ncbi:STN domain-containing protein [Bradyrhizobium sp. U87765 SZCCT0131]|uniref:STN domain-containing protein n=1 Tax=unclassified Bradyrhizobium TaxID=2631580 RepID=UPI001BAC87DD|nr:MULTISPECIES: STN domain-containing protein [unclassified Bradyrhizobium]MBR1220903.1 STN domain-containing protein [Bradyrhizobium sp. U87765 SZCCT0131]MBR1260277.1 STN domain-containing protein [Bradyrhizobium sp. U87765 SZCCT0134]MBR1307474.1 STN domain-containing protein [Bradyrhizobium sp. U87765 SZCCT0110]MBR1321428.1 STN domain-containing protein [Bradyrhizobium sp. U87765 SZCCT0109]MBR1349741.1 STN domain-containing protein [Bradyrhizobium sp. U87765 SZCCT0048]
MPGARGSQEWLSRVCVRVAAFFLIMQCVSSSLPHADATEYRSTGAAPLHFHIAALPLGDALEIFARVSGREILYAGELATGRRSAAVDGAYRPETALQILLAGTGLLADAKDDGVFVVMRQDVAGANGVRNAVSESAYYGRIQTALRRTFCGWPVSPIERRVAARLWIGPSGEVLQVKGLAEADSERDRIEVALRGLRIGPPPSGFAQPVTIVIRSGPLDERRECTAALPSPGAAP